MTIRQAQAADIPDVLRAALQELDTLAGEIAPSVIRMRELITVIEKLEHLHALPPTDLSVYVAIVGQGQESTS